MFKIFHQIIILLSFIASNTYSSSNNGSPIPFWPLSPENKNEPEREINCETCQALCEISSTAFEAYTKKKGVSKKGMVDVAILEIANSDHLCTFGYWNFYAEKSQHATYNLISKCKEIIDQNEDEFELILYKNHQDPKSMAAKFCIPKYCQELWTKDDHPKSRESQKEINLRYASEFAKWNQQQPDIVTLPSGLQYKIISEGENGKISPKATDKVKVHYEGKSLNGKIFDSSYKRAQPTTFPVNGVVQGWSEGLQLMKEGDKWQFFIPPTLGYGEVGAGNAIGPNEFLVFDVHLIEVLNKNSGEL